MSTTGLFYVMYCRFCKGLGVVLTSLTADAAAPYGAPTTGGVKTKQKRKKVRKKQKTQTIKKPTLKKATNIQDCNFVDYGM